MAATWSEESGERGETGCHNKLFVLIDGSGVVVSGVVDISSLHVSNSFLSALYEGLQTVELSFQGLFMCQLVERIKINKWRSSSLPVLPERSSFICVFVCCENWAKELS